MRVSFPSICNCTPTPTCCYNSPLVYPNLSHLYPCSLRSPHSFDYQLDFSYAHLDSPHSPVYQPIPRTPILISPISLVPFRTVGHHMTGKLKKFNLKHIKWPKLLNSIQEKGQKVTPTSLSCVPRVLLLQS